MPDKQRGLYDKFFVTRTDGTSGPGGKHEGCQYFVLDLDHDRHARPALAAYMKSCQSEYPALAADLHALLYGCAFGGIPTAELGREKREPPSEPTAEGALQEIRRRFGMDDGERS